MLEEEAISTVTRQSPERVNTTDIEPDDPDIETRLKNFGELSKRLKEHLENTAGMTRGSDYKTNMYVRKLALLAKKGTLLWRKRGVDFGLDVEGQKEYIEGLKKQQAAVDAVKKDDPVFEPYLYPAGVRFYQSFHESAHMCLISFIATSSSTLWPVSRTTTTIVIKATNNP